MQRTQYKAFLASSDILLGIWLVIMCAMLMGTSRSGCTVPDAGELYSLQQDSLHVWYVSTVGREVALPEAVESDKYYCFVSVFTVGFFNIV